MSQRRRYRGPARCLLIGSLALATAATSAPATPQQSIAEIPPRVRQMVEKAPSLSEARRRLLWLREREYIDQQGMLALARWVDEELRGRLLRRLGVVDASPNASVPNPERTGTAPAVGRGVFSDEDIQAKTQEQLQRLLRQLRASGFEISDQNRFYVRVPALDTVIWKPGQREAALARPGAFIDENMARSLDPEFARGAKPGARPHPLESVLENTTKGRHSLFDPLLPDDYDSLPPAEQLQARLEREQALIGGAKDVVRSLEATGLRDRYREIYDDLDALRRMEIGPADERITRHGDLQELMRRLMGDAYREAEAQLRREIDQVERMLRNPLSEVERRRGAAMAAELTERLGRVAVRFEVMSDLHPEAMRGLTGRTAFGFAGEQASRMRRLAALSMGAEDANLASGRTRALSIAVDALQFVQCLEEGRSPRQCVIEAVAGAAMGEVLSRFIGAVTLVTPAGGILATVIIAGRGVRDAAVQVNEAYVEYVRMRAAETAAEAAEATSAAAERDRTRRFTAAIALHEQQVARWVAEIATRKTQLLSDLRALEDEHHSLIADASASDDLDALTAAVGNAVSFCYQLAEISNDVGPMADRAQSQSERVEPLVRKAIAAARSCSSRAALERAQRFDDDAAALARDIAATVTEAESLAAVADSAAAELRARLPGHDLAGTRQRAADLLAGVRRTGRAAEELEAAVRAFSGRVDELNVWIEATKRDLRVNHQVLRGAFAESLIGMVEANSARLQDIEHQIEAITPLEPSAWTDRALELTATSGLRHVIEYARSPELDELDHELSYLEECEPGGAFDVAELLERLDTARVLAEMATSVLGRAYVAARGDCLEQLRARQRSGGAAPRAVSGGAATPARGRNGTEGIDRDRILREIAAAQADLDCLLEGQRKHPRASLDCNDEFTVRSRELEIETLRQFIRKQRARLGEATSRPDDSGAGRTARSGTRAASTAEPMAARVSAVTGEVRYGYGDAPAAAVGNGMAPGDALRVGPRASAELVFEDGSVVRVESRSVVRLDGSPGQPRMFLEFGAIEVDHSLEGDGQAPSSSPPMGVRSSPLVVATRHLSVHPVGTRYRVQTEEGRTDVVVFLGRVRLEGSFLARTDDTGKIVTSSAANSQLELAAGERGVGLEGSADRVAEPGSGRTPRGGGPTPAPGSGHDPLGRPDPWNDPQVQALIDVWLSTAVPAVSGRGAGSYRYNEWGIVVGPGIRAVATPEHPAGWSRHRVLWARRDRYDSLNLCTLGEFVRRAVRDESTDDCYRPAPDVAEEAGNNPERRRGGENAPAAEAPEPAPDPHPGARDVSSTLAWIQDIPAAYWVNGHPRLSGRRVEIVTLVPGFGGRAMQRCLARLAALRDRDPDAVRLALSPEQLWQMGRKLSPVERFKKFLRDNSAEAPAVLVPGQLDALAELVGPGIGNSMYTLDERGRLIAAGECREP